MTKDVNPSLNGVRGVAIVLVMLYHFVSTLASSPSTSSDLPIILRTVASAGWIGVDLFFVLSGFLITRILLNTKDQSGYFKNFYIRRALRIFPLYYAVLTIVFVVAPLSTGISSSMRETHASQFWIWAYGTNIVAALSGKHLATDLFSVNHFWSLAIEEQFYLFWPIVVYYSSPRRLLRITCAMVVFAIFARAVVHHTYGGRAAYLLTPCRWDALAIGAALAVLIKYRIARNYLERFAMPSALVAASVFVCIMLIQRDTSPNRIPMQLLGYPAIAISAAHLIAWCVAREEQQRRLLGLTRGPLPFLGKYSYGLYVFHELGHPLLLRIIPWLSASTGEFACAIFIGGAFGASLVAAWTSYNLLEDRFLRLKRHFESRAPAAEFAAHVA